VPGHSEDGGDQCGTDVNVLCDQKPTIKSINYASSTRYNVNRKRLKISNTSKLFNQSNMCTLINFNSRTS